MLQIKESDVKKYGPQAAIASAWLQKHYEPNYKPASWCQVFNTLERETGIHIPYFPNIRFVECPQCGETHDRTDNFCPNCGCDTKAGE